MTNVDLIKSITDAFCEDHNDHAVLVASFAPDFRFWSNGQPGGLDDYSAGLESYSAEYEGFSIPAWDELFSADDKVVVAYRLEGKKKDGSSVSMYVMAVWQVRDGAIVSLRQAIGPLAS